MKQIKILAAAIVCWALLFTTAQAASAPAPLDDTWFQIDVAVKGELVDPMDSSATKASVKRTAYLYVYDDGGDYEIRLWSETAPGVWNVTSPGSVPSVFRTGEGVFLPLTNWVIVTPDPTVLNFYVSGKFTLTVNKDDTLKKAKLSIQGATMISAPFDPITDEILFGTVKVKAKMIDEDKLPDTLLP